MKEEERARRVFKSPDLSTWCTPDGFAERTGVPADDPRIVALSELAQTTLRAADGRECGVVLAYVHDLLGMLFQQMGDNPREEIHLTRQFTKRLVNTSKKWGEDDLVDLIAKPRRRSRKKAVSTMGEYVCDTAADANENVDDATPKIGMA
jgi:hypothetical protein